MLDGSGLTPSTYIFQIIPPRMSHVCLLNCHTVARLGSVNDLKSCTSRSQPKKRVARKCWAGNSYVGLTVVLTCRSGFGFDRRKTQEAETLSACVYQMGKGTESLSLDTCTLDTRPGAYWYPIEGSLSRRSRI